MGTRRPWRAAAAVGLLLAAAAVGAATDVEYETMADQLSERALELAECRGELQQLKLQLAALQDRAASTEPASDRQGDQDVRGELDRVQEELAAAEERLAAAHQQLADDESDEAATGRDLRVLAGQLSATRLALVEARTALAAQEARLGGSCAPAGEGASQAVLLELQECREDVATLREGATCAGERAELEAVRRRIAALAAENAELATKLGAAGQGGCPPPPPCTCDAHVAPVTGTSAARPSGRRTELLQNQLLADALGEVQALEAENERLRASLKDLAWESGTLGDLKASLAACHNRSAELAEELAATSGVLKAAERRAGELEREREELKASLTNSEAHTKTCATRAGNLVEAQRRLQEAAQDAERRARAAGAACDRRLDAAKAELSERLAAVEAALAAAERDKAAAGDKWQAAEGARREAEVARATAEAKLQLVQESKEAEVARLERLLAAHEEAERQRQLAAQMLREAETGWLPLWAQRRWRSLSAAAGAQAAAAQANLAGAYRSALDRTSAAASAGWQSTSSAVGARLGPVVAGAQQAAAAAWEQHLRPLLAKHVRSWPEIEAAARRSASQAADRASQAAAAAQQRAASAKAAADAALLQQLRRVPQLAPLATPAVASAAVWSVVAAVTLPLAWALAMATVHWLLFRLRPGRVAVAPPSGSAAWDRLEAALGYQYESDAVRAAALDGDSSAGTGRFAWLGAAVLQLLAAEAAIQQSEDVDGPQALAAAAVALGGEAALAARAAAAGIPQLVCPGPGARALALAAAKERELWAACLGAAYADAGFQLEAARRVYEGRRAKPAAANGGAE